MEDSIYENIPKIENEKEFLDAFTKKNIQSSQRMRKNELFDNH